MTPALIVMLDEMPVNANGKLDKKRLPAPELSEMNDSVEYVAPTSKTELALEVIWKNILSIDGFGIKHSFFEIGGHSLKAARLTAYLFKEFNVKVELKSIFSNPTIEDQAKFIENASKEIYRDIPLAETAESYPVSHGQKRLWVLNQFENQLSAYNIPFQIELELGNNVPEFEKAFLAVIDRHEILRTVFKMKKTGEVRQFIVDTNALDFNIMHLDLYGEEGKELEIQRVKDSLNQPFDLEKGPLFRVALVKTSDKNYLLSSVFHHIIMDAWSTGVMIKDVLHFYHEMLGKAQTPIQPLKIQYKDFAVWQSTNLEGAQIKESEQFWRGIFKKETTPLNLPSEKKRPQLKSFNGRSLNTIIPSNSFSKITKKNEGTLFMSLLAAWNLTLKTYSGLNDIVIGAPVAGREHTDLENQIGFYINTIAIRNKIEANSSFSSFYAQVKENVLGAFQHQAYPYDKLIEDIDVVRDTGRNALFDVMLTLQNANDNNGGQKDDSIEYGVIKDNGAMQVKFDLSIVFQEVGNDLAFTVIYNQDIYEQDMITRLMGHFNNCVQFIANNLDCKVDDIEFLKEEDKVQYQVNDQVTINSNTLVELFKEQVLNNPNKIAISCRNDKMSYQELNEKSNQFSAYLQANSEIKTEDLVGVKLERSEWQVIAILGILKAGGAYVPIDPAYPQKRIEFIQEDANCSIVIDQQLIEDFKNKIDNFASNEIKKDIKPSNLAYVIYTSGSTGVPKGVMIEHRNVVNLLSDLTHVYKINSNENILLFSSISFDASVEQIFLALTNGATLCIPQKEEVLFHDQFELFLEKNEITHIHSVPEYLKSIASIIPATLKRIISGGDVFESEILSKIGDKIDLYNEYGPTETTVTSTVLKIDADAFNSANIGRSIANTYCVILDENEKFLPIGVVGEICIGGRGVARGYLNNPDLTAEKFISDPINQGRSLYKTGDLGHISENGDLIFHGRQDRQLKIRGHRIEPNEIKLAILNHEKIEDSIVKGVSNAKNEKELVLYYCAETNIENSNLRTYLMNYVPSYMLPTHYVWLDEIPLMANGKVDLLALPDPQASDQIIAASYTPPKSDLEKRLVQLWEEVLNRTQIGVEDNFFDVGGNSLKLIQLSAKLGDFGLDKIPLVNLFATPTIKSLIGYLDDKSYNQQSTEESKDLALKQFQSKGSQDDNDIAIVGLACSTVGAKNKDEFWDALTAGEELLQRFSLEELIELGLDEQIVNHPNFVPVSSKIVGDEMFDHEFFSYLQREAETLDPQTRFFHKTAWQALEDAGIIPDDPKNNVGVFCGGGKNLMWKNYTSFLNKDEFLDGFTIDFLNEKDNLGSLVAYKLGLTGPVVTFNTTCSTSLVAVHLGARSLLLGECNVALAGGVRVSNHFTPGYFYHEGGILSKDGYCKPFDQNSSGTLAADASGVVVLKRLKDAIADGNQIYGIVKGSAVNNDGARKVGFTAPSIDGQADCIEMAHKIAGVDPESISYIETHGTATNLGDPIEFEGIIRGFKNKLNNDLSIGALKSNLGHADAAAGVMGLIKTVLCIKNAKLVPTLHYSAYNPAIENENNQITVNTAFKDWETDQVMRRAGVSSFGIGGTNAHVVLENYTQIEKAHSGTFIVPVSAKSQASLDGMKANLANFLESNGTIDLGNIAHTLQTGRKSFGLRKTYAVSSVHELMQKLKADKLSQAIPAKESNSAVFMFSGQGSQYAGMSIDLYENNADFAYWIDRGLEELTKLGMPEAKEVLLTISADDKRINQTNYTQPLLFIVEYALYKLFEKVGVKADGFIGHSVGEYVAACLCGVFSFENGLKLMVKRGGLMLATPTGGMISISKNAEEIRPFLTDELDIAVINTADNCVVSGYQKAVQNLKVQLEQDGINYVELKTSNAFHSPTVNAILPEFKELLNTIELAEPHTSFISNVTGKAVLPSEVVTPEYWMKHLRNTVQFSEGIGKLIADGHTTFIEIGPGRTLSSLAKLNNQTDGNITAVSLIRHPKVEANDFEFYYEALGRLWESGIQLDWTQLNPEGEYQILSLPTYFFNESKFTTDYDLQGLLNERINFKDPNEVLDAKSWYSQEGWKKGIRITNENSEALANIAVFGEGGTDFDGIDSFFENYSDHVNTIVLNLAIENIPDSEVADELERITQFLKTIGESEIENLTIYFISKNGQQITDHDPVNCNYGLMQGMALVMSQEYPELTYRIIDVESELSLESIMTVIATELKHTRSNGSIIGYRGQQSWLRKLDQSDDLESKIQNWTEQTIVIIGGLGNAGKILSEHLIKAYNTSIAIIGRNEAENLSNEKLDWLAKFDGNIAYYQADVSKADSFKNAISKIRDKGDTIKGIIHLAGDLSQESHQVIGHINSKMINRQLKPKMAGVLNIARNFENSDELDFVWCSSSLSTLIGGLGRAGYTAANSYLNSRSHLNDSFGEKMVSIALDGIVYSNSADYNYLIDPETLCEIFDKTWHQQHLGTLYVSKTDLQNRFEKFVIDREVYRSDLNNGELEIEQSSLESDSEKPLMNQLIELWINIFGENQITEQSDFFEIGGNSLLGVRLLNIYNKMFEVELTLDQVIRNSKLHEHEQIIANSRNQSVVFEDIPSVSIAEKYAVTDTQKRFWLLSQTNEGNVAYQIHSKLRFQENFSFNIFRKALELVIQKHEILRTVFHYDIELETLFQKILTIEELNFNIPISDLSEHGNISEALLDNWNQSILTPFDLANGPLIRVEVFKISANSYEVQYALHHIISDGWSMELLKKEIASNYEMLLQGNDGKIEPLSIQFKDYSAWINNRIKNGELEQAQQYYKDLFKENVPLISFDNSAASQKDGNGEEMTFLLSEKTREKWQEITRENKGTNYTTLMALIGILFNKWTKQNRMVLGSSFAGRQHFALENQLGPYLNTLPVVIQVDEDETFETYYTQVKDNFHQTINYQSYPLGEIINSIKSEGNENVELFNVLVEYHSGFGFNQKEEHIAVEYTEEPISILPKIVQFDLGIELFESNAGLKLMLNYRKSLFTRDLMEVIKIRIENIMNQMDNKIILNKMDPDLKKSLNNLIEKEESF